MMTDLQEVRSTNFRGSKGGFYAGLRWVWMCMTLVFVLGVTNPAFGQCTYSAAGTVFTVNIASGREVTVVSADTYYTMTINGANWAVSVVPGASSSGNVLTISATGLSNYDTFVFKDDGTGAYLYFGNSGSNKYYDNFSVLFDNLNSNLTFTGSTSFTGASNSLSVTTDGPVKFNAGSVTADGANSGISINSVLASGTSITQAIMLYSGSSIQCSGSGGITIKGDASLDSRDGIGVYLNSASIISGAAGSQVSVTGIGIGSAGTGGTGVNMLGAAGAEAFIGSTGGNVIVNGSGSTGSANSNHGVSMDTNTRISAGGSGTVTVTGTGGGTGASGGNCGVRVLATSTITSGGSGSVTVIGNGGNNSGTSGNANYGVYLLSTGRITSGGGNVTVNGYGGGGLTTASSSTNNYGIYLNTGGTITSGGSGTVSVSGRGGNSTTGGTGGSNNGVNVYSTGSIITSGGGDVSVTATGGGLNGTSPSNYGLFVFSASITTGGGNLNITGIEGRDGNAIYLNNSSLTTASGTGNLYITGNSIFFNINNAIAASSSKSVTILPYTSGVGVDLGTTNDAIGGPIGLSVAELGYISGGTINIGNTSTGSITISKAVTLSSNYILTNSSSGGLLPKATGTDVTMGSGKTLTVTPAWTLKISIGGTIVDTNYDQYKVNTAVNLDGAILSLTGAYTPLTGNVFTILSSTSVSGTFTGLPEAANFVFNGHVMRINYSATAVTLTETGTGILTWTGALSSDVTNSGNWSPSGLPGSGSVLYIPDVTIDPIVNVFGVAGCKSLTIAPGGVLTISARNTLTVSEAIVNNAGATGLVIKSDATGNGSFIGPATAATVERYLPASKWILLSSPVTSATNSLYTGMYMKQYSEGANAFGPLITATNVALTPGTGSAVWATAEKTVIYSGTINSGTINVTTPKTTQGFTLAGNPFTSAIDWNSASGWNKTNIAETIWIWNQTAGQYATWNGTAGTNSGTRYLAPGQGFFVQASSTGASLGIASGAQVHNTVSLMRSVKVEPDIMRVLVTGNSYSDEMIIANIPGALSGIDYSFDAQKMMGSEAAPQLYTVKAQTMMTIASFSTIDASTEIPVCIKVGAAGDYTLNFINNLNPDGLYTFLRDNQSMKITSVADQPSVTFTALSLDDPNRFTLLFNSQSIITGTPENTAGTIRVWNSGQKLNVVIPGNEELVNIEIYNLNGNKLRTITSAPLRDIDLNLNTAMYIVKVKTTKQVQISKIVLY